MSRYGMDWAPYVPVAERRRKAEKLTAKLRKQGQALAPVVIEGRAVATTFWGKAWCSNLEAYRDYESRLPRGRSYARNGAVIDLQIAPGEVRALISGSEIYRTSVQIRPLPQPAWRRLCADCAGRIDSLVELLQGRFSKAVMERLCRQDGGLFPRPAEIHFSCSCPDHASMCKHVAAVLYGVGARLDHQPDLLFRLRAVDGAELVAGTAADLPLGIGAPAADRVLQADDMAALFGLDMAVPAEPRRAAAKPAVERPAKVRGEASAAVPPTERVAATRTAKSAKPGAKPGAPRSAGFAKVGAAAAHDFGTPGPVAKAVGAIAVKAGRKTSKAADGGALASASARAAKATGGKAAPRARSAEQAPRPPKAATAGRAAPEVQKAGMSKAPRAPGMSPAEQRLAVRDRANWSWKARAAARKAKKV
ncbi:MAG TPA: SWIM zinc finger family protein [Acetobacteraceae bacterium]